MQAGLIIAGICGVTAIAIRLVERANNRTFQKCLRKGQELDWRGVSLNGVWLDRLVVEAVEGSIVRLKTKDEVHHVYVARNRIGEKGLV